jgi:BACON domain-containing protein
MLTQTAPTIAARFPWLFSHLVLPSTLCYPARYYSTRGGCPSSVSLAISNTGGGTLNWTSTKSATWIKRSPKYGTAPSTMTVSVDGTGLATGYHYGWIKIWAPGATNSPLKVYIKMLR